MSNPQTQALHMFHSSHQPDTPVTCPVHLHYYIIYVDEFYKVLRRQQWEVFRLVAETFLGNHNASYHTQLIQQMHQTCRIIVRSKLLKITSINLTSIPFQ
jgi:hypothetical protein